MSQHKEPLWRVFNIDIEWHQGRDHQVVNPHRNGRIDVTLGTGQPNSSLTLRYFFAAGDIIENSIENETNMPENQKVAWFGEVIDSDLINQNDKTVPDEWKRIANQELEWLGFTVVTESPPWNYP